MTSRHYKEPTMLERRRVIILVIDGVETPFIEVYYLPLV